MLVTLVTQRVKKNRKRKQDAHYVYKESLIYSVYCTLYFMDLYGEYTVSCILRID